MASFPVNSSVSGTKGERNIGIMHENQPWKLIWIDQERKNSPDICGGVGKGTDSSVGAWDCQNS